MKKLFIIRHAKSSWDDPSLSDFDRPLNKRGKNDAPLMGKVLLAEGVKADCIIASPANRAITTAKTIAQEIGFTAKIEENQKIYGAGTQDMIDIINEVDSSVNELLIFGHNPTFTYLAEELSEVRLGNLPTTGVVGIEFEFEDWAMVSRNTGHCFYYDYPKRHK